ncbi:hypothetical protein M2324_001664 [Rhodovulum sulfidophilum]|nr:hypothetical protein [Rhodovulum sulfidophilum]
MQVTDTGNRLDPLPAGAQRDRRDLAAAIPQSDGDG